MAFDSEVLQVLRGIVDPEVGLNIVDLGLVYRADRTDDAVDIAITMTTRACPLAALLLAAARAALAQRFPDVPMISASLVWDPPWTADMITPDGRQQLGY